MHGRTQLICDLLVLTAAILITIQTLKPTIQTESQLQPPTVDWTEAYLYWYDTTNDYSQPTKICGNPLDKDDHH